MADLDEHGVTSFLVTLHAPTKKSIKRAVSPRGSVKEQGDPSDDFSVTPNLAIFATHVFAFLRQPFALALATCPPLLLMLRTDRPVH